MATTTPPDLQKLSHDIRNALHAVSINLEVARMRAERGIADSAELVPFLHTAASQLESVTRLHKQLADFALALSAEVLRESNAKNT